MLCDFCSKNEASVHLTQIVNEEKQELHLCEVCAREKGVAPALELPAAGLGGGFSDLLAGLADFGVKLEGAGKIKITCPQCGMTYEDFRKSGRLGCGRCYQAFEQALAPLLKRIHGSVHHVGKSPASAAPKKAAGKTDLNQLKEQLKAAVASENFEEAVRLRDQIRILEAKSKKRS